MTTENIKNKLYSNPDRERLIKNPVDGEHSLVKPSCLEYCRMDRLFCPLANCKIENGTLSVGEYTANLWTGKRAFNSELEATMSEPDPLTYGLSNYEEEDLTDFPEEIPDYEEKLRREVSHFEGTKWVKGWSDFTCWLDGSGFEYDQMPENLVGPSGVMERQYSLDSYPIEIDSYKLSNWNTWVNKFQRDYRFGQVSDLNAETTLFPNVDDPWMFTEYVFKGVGEGDVIVEPPLFDEVTLDLCNPDKTLRESDLEHTPGYFEEEGGKLYEDCKQQILDKYELTHIAPEGTPVKSFREITPWKSHRGGTEQINVEEQGRKLYRADINVESVKWGEHGNIPPNTINMAAPERWMDYSASAAGYKARTIAHVGTPYSARKHGVVYWEDKEAWIEAVTIEFLEPGFWYDIVSGSYEIKSDGCHGVKQRLPQNARPNNQSGRDGAKLIKRYINYGELSHGGCQMMKSENRGDGWGICYCQVMRAAFDNNDTATVQKLSNYVGEKCLSFNGNKSCPNWVGGPEYPILADFEGVAYNAAQYKEAMFGVYSGEKSSERAWADNMLNGSGRFGDIFGVFSQNRLGRDDVYNPTEAYVWYETQFDVVYNTSSTPELDGRMGANGFGKGVKVKRGTGKTALDTREAKDVIKGDSVYYDDISQTGFNRWLTSPMLCADVAHCNEFCGQLMKSDWEPGIRAGNAAKGECRYYRDNSKNKGCPYNAVQKRAFEFQQTMAVATQTLLALARMWFAATTEEREQYKYDKKRQFYIERYTFDLTRKITTHSDIRDDSDAEVTYWNIYLCDDTQEKAMGGILVKETKEITIMHPKNPKGEQEEETFTGKLIGRFCYDKVYAPKAYFWYQSMDNAGNNQKIWFCQCDESYKPFSTNAIIITNEEKFIGGYHPQYKNYSKRGEEFLMDVVSDDYRDAMGEIVGDVEHDGQPQAVNKKGYWTDEDGEFIVDEPSLGLEGEIMSDEGRENPSSSPITISIKKSNTEINGTTGESKSPLTIKCAVNSNDNYYLIEKYKTGVRDSETNKVVGGRPSYEDPSTDKKYWAPPYVKDLYALPTMRMAAHCPNCDYYLAYKYHDMRCPWCGSMLQTISGDMGLELEAGDFWVESEVIEDLEGNVIEEYPELSVIKKFFKLNAIGRVQVWAPPGTCIPKNGYFWKNPAVVTDTTIREIKYKLGEFSGSRWKLNSNLKDSSFNLGYPEQVGEYAPMEAYTTDEAVLETSPRYGIEWEGATAEDRNKFASENPVMPNQMMPSFKLPGSDFVEGLMLPYTANSDDGLKIATAAEMVRLRNRMEPLLAYSSEPPSPRDYSILRATFENRTKASTYKYNSKRHCRVPSVILACNQSGNDSWVQFFSGDAEWGAVREYYPGGQSWWWINQLIGSRYSDLSGGIYHFDGENRRSGGHYTVSKCAMFINGILPLDKEILKAYIIITPAGVPSKEPIGRGWNGYYHYEHFHGFTKNHPVYGDGEIRHLHGQAGTEGYYDDDGVYWGSMEEYSNAMRNKKNEVIPLDAGAYHVLGGEPKNYHSFIWHNFKSEWTGLSGVLDEGFWHQPGVSELSYDNLWKNGRCANIGEEQEEIGYISMDSENNIVENYNSDKVWGKIDSGTKDSVTDDAITELEFTITDGTGNGTEKQTFYQFDTDFIERTFPAMSQEIPNYIDMSGTNTEMRLKYAKSNSSEVYPQAEDVKPEVGVEAGYIERIIDVTSVIKKLYNERVDRSYMCKTGKSLSELQYDAAWGILFPEVDASGFPVSKIHKIVMWNKTDFWAKNSYLLNDEEAPYPKLETDMSLPEMPIEGEEYPLGEEELVITCNFTLPFNIDKDCRNYDILINETDSQGSLADKKIALPEEVVEICRQIFPDSEVTVTSDTSVMVKYTGETVLTIYDCKDSVYQKLGLVVDRFASTYNRIIEFTSKKYGNKLSAKTPWETENFHFEPQHIVYDLCRAAPLESVRPYRNTPPSIDCRSCKCHTIGCSAYDQVVGIYAEQHKITMGASQTTCPGSCKKDLSKNVGAVRNDGDGITSYEYKGQLGENPFVNYIYVDIEPGLSYSVCLQDTESDLWKTVVSVYYNQKDKKYRIAVGNEAPKEVKNLPKDFSIPEQTARFAKLIVTPNPVPVFLSYTGESKFIKQASTWLRVRGEFQDFGLFDWQEQKVTITYTDDTSEMFPLANAAVSDDFHYLDLYLQGVMKSDSENEEIGKVKQVYISTVKYASKVNEFRVYGFHYLKDELTRTPPGEEEAFVYSHNTHKFQLKEYPTQITGVYLNKFSFGTVQLTPVDSYDKMELIGTEYTHTDLKTNLTVTLWEITGGSYYFNYKQNAVCLPLVVKCGNAEIALDELEKKLKNGNLSDSRFPGELIIQYWTGSGTSVVLEAQAVGQGPSYQVEKGAISRIDTRQLSEEEGGGGLPYNGMSELLPDSSGKYERRPVPWVCSNIEAATLSEKTQSLSDGGFKTPNFASTELGKNNNDSYFIDLFGKNNENCIGQCVTRVMLTGTPNQIISGGIKVTAPALTKKEIETPSGTAIQYERTGGLKNGCFITKVVIPPCQGRKTLAFAKPKLLIYAKDRGLEQELED